jgi:transposase
LAALREMFAIVHRRDEYPTEAAFRGALEDQGFEVWLYATFRRPQTNKAQNLANRFHEHGREYLRFITIRFVVLDRRVTHPQRRGSKMV